MKRSLVALSSTNKFAKDLLEIVKQRWSSTSDDNLLHLASFINPSRMVDWKVRYACLAQKFEHGGMQQKDKDSYAAMNAEANLMVETTVKYASHMGYSFNKIDSTVNYLLTVATISKNRQDIILLGRNRHDSSKYSF